MSSGFLITLLQASGTIVRVEDAKRSGGTRFAQAKQVPQRSREQESREGVLLTWDGAWKKFPPAAVKGSQLFISLLIGTIT